MTALSAQASQPIVYRDDTTEQGHAGIAGTRIAYGRSNTGAETNWELPGTRGCGHRTPASVTIGIIHDSQNSPS